MHYKFISLSACFLFAACEKDSSVNLQQQEEQLVIEGKIETRQYLQVILTHSFNYFSNADAGKLLGAFVHNASITVSDGNTTVPLKEYVKDTTGGLKCYIYSTDARTPGASKGERGKTYPLHITADNKSYEAVTTIPVTGQRLDAIWCRRVLLDKDTTKVRLIARISDIPTPGNTARYFTRRNREPFLPGLHAVMNDDIVNGTTFDIALSAGVDKNQPIDPETFGFFNLGDTVTLKFCNINRSTYDFWRTLDFRFSSANPFSTPVQVAGNIPGALGYWGGDAVTFKNIIGPK